MAPGAQGSSRPGRPTAEQAAAELRRRKLPRDRRGEGRDEAVRLGVFRMSTPELRRIAEGGS